MIPILDWLSANSVSIWATIIILVWWFVVFVMVTERMYFLAFVPTAVAIGLLSCLEISVWTLLFNYWWLIPFYLFVGVLWTAYKWYSLVKSKSLVLIESINDNKRYWLNMKQLPLDKPIPAELITEWQQYLAARVNLTPPQVSDYRCEIMTWLAFWPILMPAWLFEDVFKKIISKVYNSISGFLQNISNKVYYSILKKIGVEIQDVNRK